jgi:hypothetical protein
MASAHSDRATGQAKAIDVADGFRDHDMAALSRLSPAGRAEQVQLRERLYRYVDAMWDQIKASHRRHGGAGPPRADDPAYSAVAGMRDLLGELHTSALAAAQSAGEETG